MRTPTAWLGRALEHHRRTEDDEREEQGCELALHALVAKLADVWSLSPREQQVLLLAAVGLRTKEIAAQIGRSEKTIETYWTRLLHKAGVAGREELFAAMLRAAVRDNKQTPAA